MNNNLEIIKTTRVWKFGIVIAKDKITNETNVYTWYEQWFDEELDTQRILQRGQKTSIIFRENFFKI